MEIIFLLIGLAAGITLGYLLASRKVSALQTQMKLQQKHVEELQQVEKTDVARKAGCTKARSSRITPSVQYGI